MIYMILYAYSCKKKRTPCHDWVFKTFQVPFFLYTCFENSSSMFYHTWSSTMPRIPIPDANICIWTERSGETAGRCDKNCNQLGKVNFGLSRMVEKNMFTTWSIPPKKNTRQIMTDLAFLRLEHPWTLTHVPRTMEVRGGNLDFLGTVLGSFSTCSLPFATLFLQILGLFCEENPCPRGHLQRNKSSKGQPRGR